MNHLFQCSPTNGFEHDFKILDNISNYPLENIKMVKGIIGLACRNAQWKAADYLIQIGMDINEEFDKFAPIYYAIRYQCLPMVIHLHRNGADINIKSFAYKCPLGCAIETKSLDIIKYLINCKAVIPDDYIARLKRFNDAEINYLLSNL